MKLILTLGLVVGLLIGCGDAATPDTHVEEKTSAVIYRSGPAPSLSTFDSNAWLTITNPPQFNPNLVAFTGRAKWRLTSPSSLSQGGTWTLQIRPYSTRNIDKYAMSCDIPMAYYENNFTSVPMYQFGDGFQGNQGYWFNYTTNATCTAKRRVGAFIQNYSFTLPQYSFYIFEAMSRPRTYQAQGLDGMQPLRTHFNGQMINSNLASTWAWDSSKWPTSCQGCTFPNGGDRERLDEAVDLVWNQTYGMGAYPPPEMVFIEGSSLNCPTNGEAFIASDGTCAYGEARTNTAGDYPDKVFLSWDAVTQSILGKSNLFRAPFSHELCHTRQVYLGLDGDPGHQGPCFYTPDYSSQGQMALQNAGIDDTFLIDVH